MKEATVEMWKMVQIALLLMALLMVLSGCGKEEKKVTEEKGNPTVMLSAGVDIDHFGSAEWSGNREVEE